MKKFLEKQTVGSYSLMASILFILIGFIIFLVSSTTGYLAGKPVDVLTILFTLLGIAFALVEIILHDKLEGIHWLINDFVIVAAGIMYGLALTMFMNSRVAVAADVWFIPVNYPVAEATCLNISIVCVVFYGLGLIGACIAAFTPRFYLKAAN